MYHANVRAGQKVPITSQNKEIDYCISLFCDHVISIASTCQEISWEKEQLGKLLTLCKNIAGASNFYKNLNFSKRKHVNVLNRSIWGCNVTIENFNMSNCIQKHRFHVSYSKSGYIGHIFA